MSRPPIRTTLTADQAALCGMSVAVAAREAPDRLAIASSEGDRTFDHLNARANQLARALRRRGLGQGDAVALLCSNRPEFAVVTQAALRSGLRLTPINWHLTLEEVSAIVEDCDAKVLIADAVFASAARRAAREAGSVQLRIAVGDPIAGFDDYEAVLEPERPDDLGDPVLGTHLFYTSGITGRPKGVLRPGPASLRSRGAQALLEALAYSPEDDLHLCSGPLHHPAPLAISLLMPLAAGCGVVMMERFDPHHALELIAGYGVTHTHMVPTMFHRMLTLPAEVRGGFDLSTLRMVLHGAAPCPPDVKRQMIEWLGPVLVEYYAATEGWGSLVTSHEWLEREGTVGRCDPEAVEIRSESGVPMPPGSPGIVHLRAAEGEAFRYTGEGEGTSVEEGEWFALGDVGYIDDDGYLFLCDRVDDVIRTGGYDVYPVEIDGCLLSHPAIEDAATVGIPSPEWGEEVVAFVTLREGHVGDEELIASLLGYCRSRLARFKSPRRIVIRDALPRRASGKLLRRELRETHGGVGASH